MKIKFSRHSKQRMKLYSIPEQVVREIVEKKYDQNKDNQVIIQQIKELKYPLKVIAKTEKDTILIITAYPIKRGIL